MSPFLSQFLLISAAVILSIVLSLALIVYLIFRALPRDSEIDDPVWGRLEVTGTSSRAEHADYQSVIVTGVLIADGRKSIPVRTKSMVCSEKFPSIGDELPVVFSDKEPGALNIQWDQVLTAGQRAAQNAAQRASQINQAQQPHDMPSQSGPHEKLPDAQSDFVDPTGESPKNLW